MQFSILHPNTIYMLRTFKSRRSPYFVAWLVVLLLAMIFLFWIHYILISFILIIINMLLVRRILQTEYLVDSSGSITIIRGILPKVVIDIAEIEKIERGEYLYSPYALSSQGVWLVMKSGKRVFISPTDREQFCNYINKI